MKGFGLSAFRFYSNLKTNFIIPKNIECLLPNENRQTHSYVKLFFEKYYNDKSSRHFIFGINPGRHGAGMTGIAFTDPINLQDVCGISNDLPRKPELSSEYIYKVIQNFGGPGKFYRRFFLTSVCPIGFTREGKNLNYYDDRKLLQETKPFILQALRKQIEFGAKNDVAICLGQGKNYAFLSDLNEKYKFFKRIIPLPHPRFVMQYKRKSMSLYIERFVNTLQSIESLQKAVKNQLKN